MVTDFYPVSGCSQGRLDVHHVVPQQVIKREVHEEDVREALLDERNLIPMCRRHHELYENRRFRFTREELPASVEAFARDEALEWWLDANYPNAGEEMSDAA